MRPSELSRGYETHKIDEFTICKSNIVPAAGLEPAQASFKGWWAANYPTPEFWQSHHANIAAAAAVRTRYRPNRDGGIGGSRAPAGRNGTGNPVRLNALDPGFHSVHLVRCLRNREAD